jgi:hypothetical protein
MTALGPNVLQTIFAARESNTDSICHSVIARSLIDVEFCRDLKILRSRVHNLNIEKSADRFKSVWESPISILLDGNTEAAFSAELMTAVSTEIGMGFVPISICWHAMNNNLIPGVALRAVLFKGAGNFVWIALTAALHHSKQLNWLIAKLHAVRESCE